MTRGDRLDRELVGPAGLQTAPDVAGLAAMGHARIDQRTGSVVPADSVLPHGKPGVGLPIQRHLVVGHACDDKPLRSSAYPQCACREPRPRSQYSNEHRLRDPPGGPCAGGLPCPPRHSKWHERAPSARTTRFSSPRRPWLPSAFPSARRGYGTRFLLVPTEYGFSNGPAALGKVAFLVCAHRSCTVVAYGAREIDLGGEARSDPRLVGGLATSSFMPLSATPVPAHPSDMGGGGDAHYRLDILPRRVPGQSVPVPELRERAEAECNGRGASKGHGSRRATTRPAPQASLGILRSAAGGAHACTSATAATARAPCGACSLRYSASSAVFGDS